MYIVKRSGELQRRISIERPLLSRFPLSCLSALLSLAGVDASISTRSSFLYSARSSFLWSMRGRLSPDLPRRHLHLYPPLHLHWELRPCLYFLSQLPPRLPYRDPCSSACFFPTGDWPLSSIPDAWKAVTSSCKMCYHSSSSEGGVCSATLLLCYDCCLQLVTHLCGCAQDA